MLSLDAQTMNDLVEESAKELRRYWEPVDEMERWMTGRFFGNDFDFEVPDEWPENVPFGLVTLLLPMMAHNAPRWSLSADGTKRMREQSLGLQGALNLISRQTNLHQTLAPGVIDFLLGWACFYVDCESTPRHRLTNAQRREMKGRARYVPGEQGEDYPKEAGQPRYYDSAIPAWPTLDFLPRHSYGWDVSARTWSRVRFKWHDIVEDYEDLLARAEDDDTWDIEAIRQLGSIGGRKNPYNALEGDRSTRKIGEVRYRSIWVPEGRLLDDDEMEVDNFDPTEDKPRETKKEPGDHEHGLILTVGVADGGGRKTLGARSYTELADQPGTENRALMLRKPFYRRGSRKGPYKIGGVYHTASNTIPLSPLIATKEQIELWNDVGSAICKRIRRYSRQIVYDLKDETMVEHLANSQDDDYVGVPGFDGNNLKVVERGGAAQQDLAHAQYLQNNVYRNLGMAETLQGSAGDSTATAEKLANDTGKTKMRYPVDRWTGLLAEVGEEMCWHMAYSSDFWVVLDDEAKMEMMLQDIAAFIDRGAINTQDAEQLVRYVSQREVHIWQGGDFAEDETLDFGMMQVEVEPFSMERRDLQQQQQDILLLMPLLERIGGLIVMQPHMEWRERLRDLGRVFAMPGLERMVRMDIAQQMSQLQIAQGLADTVMGPGTGGAIKMGGPGGQSGFKLGGGGGGARPRPAPRSQAGAGAKPGGSATAPSQPMQAGAIR